MRTVIKISDLKLPEATPSQKAYFAILSLRSAPDLQRNTMVGGPTPPAMKAENALKDAEYNRRRLAIIAKYGVFDEYLAPLRADEKRLSEKLASVQAEIAELEVLQKK